LIRVISLGKVKGLWRELEREYLKRISMFRSIKVVELKEVKEENVKGYCVALDERGREVNTSYFKELLEAHAKITFIVGAKEGIPMSIFKLADEKISLSKLTLSFSLARIVLLEQIFRALCRMHNHPYDREGGV
jgi:23S rRNA (pseudouridine1915-N3)-methyltransferase